MTKTVLLLIAIGVVCFLLGFNGRRLYELWINRKG